MSSNKIIVTILVIFIVVGLIGSFAGYSSTPLLSDNATEELSYDGTSWYEWPVLYFDAALDTIFSWLDDVPVIGSMAHSLDFLMDLIFFQVDGMPDVISLFFTVLAFILSIAVFRVIAGLVTGGGD